jgi:hypothetical protein
MDDNDAKKVAHKLAEPFDAQEIKFKVQAVVNNQKNCLVIAFIDARCVMDRLDEVVGVDGWEDHYEMLDGGSALCRLRIRLGGTWVTKEDVGGESGQPDQGDKTKSAISDALKRAAVKFGIGRYLYRSKPQYMEYDQQKRKYVGTPKLPTDPNYKTEPEEAPEPQPAAPPKSDAEVRLELALQDISVAADEKRVFQILGWAKKQDFPAKDMTELELAGQARRKQLA